MSDEQSQDDLKAILGEELFNELDSFNPPEMNLEMVPEEILKNIVNKEYLLSTVFSGELATDMIAALFHAAEENCKDCEAELVKFAGAVIGTMWVQILKDEHLVGDDFE